ncbi:MAG: ABC transporter permease [Planctomycetaceae bacterium]|nr:ABC transporter permease [Planctomycetaceae bacterium]
MVRVVYALGNWTLEAILSVGEITLLFLRCLYLLPTRGLRFRREIVTQLYFIGVGSLSVVVTTGVFAGAVFAYTLYNQLVALGVGSWAGAFMAKMLTWHFGPVLIGLVLAGRVGCAITAEIGTMSVTEQVDALRGFGVSPVSYLVMPRVIAAIVMAPILTAVAIFVGLLAGIGMITWVMGGEAHYQWVQIEAIMIPYDYVQGLVKGLVFGVVIALICCRNGLATRGGAEGVGLATTSANVSSCICILVINLWLSVVLTHLQPLWDGFIARVAGM